MKHTRLIFISLLVVAVIIYIFMPSTISSVFLYSLVIALLISLIFALIGFFGIRVEEELLTPVIKRRSRAHFKIILKNRLPFGFSYINPVFDFYGGAKEDNFLIIPAPSFKPTSVQYKILYPHCGNFAVGFSYVKIIDLLGLFSFKKKIKHTEYISVVPPISKIEDFPIESFGESAKTVPTKSKSYEFAEIAGIKDYSGNEPMKQIHWNMSMKQQKLLVKEYEDELKRQITVTLLAGNISPESDVLDRILETGANIIEYAKKKGSSVRLQISTSVDRQVEMLSRDSVLSTLISNTEPLYKAYSVEETVSKDEGIQVFISPTISENHLEAILRSSTKGDGKAFVLVTSKISDEERALIEKFRQCNIKIFAVNASASTFTLKG